MAKTTSIGAKKKDPSKTSAAHDLMQPRIDLANVLMEGTPALRAARETYLPRHEVESEHNYDDRLQRSILVNYFRRSVESLVGKPFAQPLVMGDDMPPQLKDLAEDIDHQGNSINVFARKIFRDGLMKGFTHILVEFPNTADAGVQTVEDEAQINATPYFVHVPPESILAAYCDYRNGEAFLTHVRIYEVSTERVEFDEIEIERVRILEPGSWQVWRKGENDKWFKENEGTSTLDYIPLVTFYADREDFMVARPPLMDLAFVNLKHYQSSSDQMNAMTVARFPILAGSGLNEDESNIKIGPKQLLTSVAADGKFYYVEHTGAALGAGRDELKDMEEQMAILGIELLKKSGNATATAKAIDTAENLSMLQSMTLTFADALEEAFRIAAEWMGLAADSGSITINTDFGLKMDDLTDLASLQWARQNGEISHEQYLRELQRRGTLADDFDAAKDQELLLTENHNKIVEQAFQQSLMNDGVIPGQPTINPNSNAPDTNANIE